MRHFMIKSVARMVFALVAGSSAMLWSGNSPFGENSSVSQVEARVGRPATPMSYAGVARRTTRRAAAVGAAGAAAAGTYYYANPGCTQIVNSYGQIIYQCP